MNNKNQRTSKGFTLTELIIVIVIIGVLAAVLIPSLNRYIQKARKATDIALVKNINDCLNLAQIEGDIIEDPLELRNLIESHGLTLTTKSKDYDLWYNLDENKVELLELTSDDKLVAEKLAKYNITPNNPEEFVEGYFLLSNYGNEINDVVKTIREINSNTDVEEIKEFVNKIENETIRGAFINILLSSAFISDDGITGFKITLDIDKYIDKIVKETTLTNKTNLLFAYKVTVLNETNTNGLKGSNINNIFIPSTVKKISDAVVNNIADDTKIGCGNKIVETIVTNIIENQNRTDLVIDKLENIRNNVTDFFTNMKPEINYYLYNFNFNYYTYDNIHNEINSLLANISDSKTVAYEKYLPLKNQFRLYSSNSSIGTIDCLYMTPNIISEFDWDWIDIYDGSQKTVNIGDYQLSLKVENPVDPQAEAEVGEDGKIDTLKIDISIPCVQAAAITTYGKWESVTSSSIIGSNKAVFHETVNDAFEYYQEILKESPLIKNHYLRIYGRVVMKSNKLDGNCDFSKDILDKYYTLKSSTGDSFVIPDKLTVLLPYGRSDGDDWENGSDTENTSDPSGNTINSVLIIDSTTTLKINSDGALKVGGYLVHSDTKDVCLTSARGVLINEGIIESNGTILSYGFIKGGGKIDAKSGTVTDVLRVYDFHGGTISTVKNAAKYFPFNVYSTSNISCNIHLYRDVNYLLHFEVNVIAFISRDINFINGNGLFNIDDNGYIIKGSTANKSLLDAVEGKYDEIIISSNQQVDKFDTIDIYGNVKDGSISITISDNILSSLSFSTNTNYALPIGFMKITIHEGTTTFSNSSYKFAPGSEVDIKPGASVVIKSGVNIVIYSLDEGEFLDKDSKLNASMTEGFDIYKYVSSNHRHSTEECNQTGVSWFENSFSYFFVHKEYFKLYNNEDNGALIKIGGTLTLESGSRIAGRIEGYEGGKLDFNGENTVEIQELKKICAYPPILPGSLSNYYTLKAITFNFEGLIGNAYTTFNKGTYIFNNDNGWEKLDTSQSSQVDLITSNQLIDPIIIESIKKPNLEIKRY